MPYYRRQPYTEQLLSHWKSSGHSLMLFIGGARRVGKTTMVIEEAENLDDNYIVPKPRAFDQVDTEDHGFTVREYPSPQQTPANNKNILIKCWKDARRQADAHRDKTVILILDEIQKIPDWSNMLKGLWDEDRTTGRENLKITALGSAPLLIQKGQESLVGRYELITLPHWSFGEIQEFYNTDLNQYLYFGAYPEVYQKHIQNEEGWHKYITQSIVHPYLTKDVVAMAPHLRKPALLKTLFEIACSHPAQIVTYNKLRGQLNDAGNTTTVAHYLDHLREVGLVTGIEKYGNPINARRSSPKIIALNNAFATVFSGYADYSSAMNDRTYYGRLVENAIGAHLWQTLSPRAQLTYWRKGDNEVDFIITWNKKIFAIEVKSGGKFIPRHRGLAAFSQKYKGTIEKIIGDSRLPVAEFLSRPAREWVTEWGNE